MYSDQGYESKEEVKMYKKIGVYCLIISVFFIVIIDNLEAEVIINHRMTKNLHRSDECELPTAQYTFVTRDVRAYCWLEIDNVIEGDIIRYGWYGPNSELYSEYTHSMSFTGNGCAWDWIEIRNEVPAKMPGDWYVDVSYNGTLQFTENFTIVEGGSCPVTQIYGNNSEKTQLLRYVRDNIFNKTLEGQEIIALYYHWSPIIVKAMEADEEFKQEIKDMIDKVLSIIKDVVK